jgi:hypothetical protein
MVHGDAREEKWRGNWPTEWGASTFHSTSEHGVSSITTADAHTSAASSRLNWRLRRFKWTRPFRRKKKSGFCSCAITFQLASTSTPLSEGFMASRNENCIFAVYLLTVMGIYEGSVIFENSYYFRLYCQNINIQLNVTFSESVLIHTSRQLTLYRQSADRFI